MNFYVASGLQNKEAVQKVSERLTQLGWHHMYDWTLNEHVDSIETLQEIGTLEKLAVKASDVVVVMLPGGKGTHIELGMALAWDKRIFLYDPSNEVMNVSTTCTFYHLTEVTICSGSLDVLIKTISNHK